MLDVAINLNNRPLTYIEEALEYLVLTTNSMIFRSYQMFLWKRKKLEITGRSDRDMHINTRKQLRWIHEYLPAVRQTNRQTDRQTDRRTDRQTERERQREQLRLVVGSSKEAQTLPFLVFLQVLVAYVQLF